MQTLAYTVQHYCCNRLFDFSMTHVALPANLFHFIVTHFFTGLLRRRLFTLFSATMFKAIRGESMNVPIYLKIA